ncbi:DedA family protein [Serratia symbiotica]|uniref:DedA family protein n=1 Tax=Serratia symbiotica TaxID=138074 RepID=UPI001CF0A10E|nr:DedA family protein [Serratia symbiotica]
MDVLRTIIQALWHQDFTALADPSVIWVVYAVLFTTLFLENGLLSAAFLPGDSLLLLSGALIAKGVMGFASTLFILSVAAGLGCWLSYLQGRWLGHTDLVKGWLLHLPAQYHQRAHSLFNRHGLVALLISRFLGFVRTLLPTMAGISGLSSTRFQLFNWLSAAIWVSVLVGLGYVFSQLPWVKRYESVVMTGLMILPLALLMFGLLGTLLVIWRSRKRAASS